MRAAAFVAAAIVFGMSAPDACALTGAICQLPGNCSTAWSQQDIAGVVYQGSTVYNGASQCSGSQCYVNPGTGLPFNFYIQFDDDSVTPWTTAQKQAWAALFSAIGTTPWFSDMAAMYPPTNVWGALSTGATATLSNCLSGSPAHCVDVTYTGAGQSFGTCPTGSLPSDQYGIYIRIPSQPNVTCAAGNIGDNVGKLPGHCLCAAQASSVTLGTANCFGTAPSGVFGPTSGFTQPAIGSPVTVTLSSGSFTTGTTSFYVETGGWYRCSSTAPGATSCSATNLGSPVNASLGASILSGNNVEHIPGTLTPNGCVLDAQMNIALSEAVGAIEDFNGEGWAHYKYPAFPPGLSPNTTNPPASHEDCGFSAPFDVSITSGQMAANITTTFLSTTYSFDLPSWLRNSQVGSDLATGPFGYCGVNRSYSDYWNVPCRRNADCPATSGVCSGTSLGSHCIAPSCSDGIKNGYETDVDCGSMCTNQCSPGRACGSMFDCQSQVPFGGTVAYCVSGVCTSY